MTIATTLSLHSSQNSIPLTSCPPPATMVQLRPRSTATSSEQFAGSLLLCSKDHLSVFNAMQALFSVFFTANPLFSTTSSLFSAKQGGRGQPCFRNTLAGAPPLNPEPGCRTLCDFQKEIGDKMGRFLSFMRDTTSGYYGYVNVGDTYCGYCLTLVTRVPVNRTNTVFDGGCP
jgi:hypothetical protein